MKHVNRLRHMVLTACALAVGIPDDASACSLTPMTVERFGAGVVSFIGAAKSDTVRAGPGDVQFTVEAGHSGPASNRIIYGQRVNVERIAEYARTVLPGGVREVVLVPWDYNSACHPTPWGRTARWLEPGTRGVYTAELRARSHWIGGVPTLDVFGTGLYPYQAKRAKAAPDEPPLLSVDELLDVASQLPDPDMMALDAESASKSFLEWAKSHPDVWSRQPAPAVMSHVMSSLVEQQQKRISPDIAGTWKFTTSVVGVNASGEGANDAREPTREPTRVVYARTNAAVLQDWYDGSPEAVAIAKARLPWEMPRMRGYMLIAGLSPTLERLHTGCANAVSHSYLYQWAIGVRGSARERVVGDVEISIANPPFVQDTSVRAYKVVKVESAADSAQFAAARAGLGLRPGESATFVTGADGVMRVEKVWWMGMGQVLVLRGERLSRETGKCDW